MPGAPEHLQAILRGEAPLPTFVGLVGLRLTAAKPGEAHFELELDPAHHMNRMGTVHGGVLCTLADSATGFAYTTTLAEGESLTTVELKINYLKPVRAGVLRAVGRVVKGGRTIGLTECDITDETGSLVARASATCMTLRGEMARGR